RLANRYVPQLYPNSDLLADRMRMLRAGGIPPFDRMSDGGSLDCSTEEEVEVRRDLSHNILWHGDVGHATGEDPGVVLVLPRPRAVCSVKLTFVLSTPDRAAAPFQLFWMEEGRNGFDGRERNRIVGILGTGQAQTFSFDVDDTIDRIRIDPANGECD